MRILGRNSLGLEPAPRLLADAGVVVPASMLAGSASGGPRVLPRWIYWIVAGLGVASALPTPSAGQAVRGVVIDDSNQRAVPAALVRLVVGDDLGEGVETNSQGRFLLSVPRGGEYRLEVTRLGYATTRSQTFRVEDQDTVSVEFYVLPDAVLLAPITVTARSRRGRNGFERRRSEWGRGVFIDPSQVDSIAPRRSPAQLLANIEDVDLRWQWGLRSTGGSDLLPWVRTTRGRGCLRYMIDWIPVRAGDWGGFQLGMLRPDDVVAVEVYRSILEVPQELRRHTSSPPIGRALGQVNCGLVVLWTRQGW